MGQKGITSVVTCPVQKREVDVTYRKVGNWFNRKLDVLSCPAIKVIGLTALFLLRGHSCSKGGRQPAAEAV
jgi:hypothetical protein